MYYHMITSGEFIARVSSGTKFHSAMERLAKDAVDGKLNESNESILNEVRVELGDASK